MARKRRMYVDGGLIGPDKPRPVVGGGTTVPRPDIGPGVHQMPGETDTYCFIADFDSKENEVDACAALRARSAGRLRAWATGALHVECKTRAIRDQSMRDVIKLRGFVKTRDKRISLKSQGYFDASQ